jgi:prepilin-type N-terminal cleavage/methylation domain-containing protein
MKQIVYIKRRAAFTLIELLVVIAILPFWRRCCRPR